MKPAASRRWCFASTSPAFDPCWSAWKRAPGRKSSTRMSRPARPGINDQEPMKSTALLAILCAASAVAQEDLSKQLLTIKRIYVERLTGGETAAQMRDLIIASLHNAKLYVLTENAERADAVIRGAAEDLIYTDQFQSSDSVDL